MVRGGHIFTFRLMVRGGPPVDVPSGKGFQFAQIYYIKLTFNSFYALLYQPKKWAASRDNFSGTDGIYYCIVCSIFFHQNKAANKLV